MLAYILDNKNLKIKDILEFEKYEFKEDIDYSDKGSITVARKPNIDDDDYVICKNDNHIEFIGICETYKSTSAEQEYAITLLQKESLFDRQIFAEQEKLIATVGIEDFIVLAIKKNFVESGDAFMDKSYITVNAKTHTMVAAKVETENGVYNLKTYLGNAKQYYGIFLDFEFYENQLIIKVHKRDDAVIPIDIGVTDISDYQETYSVSVLAKLLVNWKIPDREDSEGIVTVGPMTQRKFFLLADRSITEDITDVNRAAGISKSVYIETETEEEMLQQVYNEFSSNQYSHKISFYLNRNSRLYPESRFYVGRKCIIRTKSGVRTSIITKSEVKNTSGMILLTFGKLKITLIEKLRR